MIGILCEDSDREAAEALIADLEEAYKGQLHVAVVSASSPTPWPDEVSWDDLLIVLYSRPEFPEAGRDFAAEFLRQRRDYSLVLPVSVSRQTRRPPTPVDGIKAIPYDGEARGAKGRIARRVGAMLGLKLRRRDNQILVSYRATDGTGIATQLHDHLTSLGYRAWLDEARDAVDREPMILPGKQVQDEIRQALAASNLLLLVETPAAGESGWIKFEIDTANADLLPVLPICLRPQADHRKGPRFRSLSDLQRWLDIPLPPDGETLSMEHLDAIVDEIETYLSEIFRRKCRVPFIVEREFVSRDFAWRNLDKRLFVYESSKQHSSRVAVKILSHCSFFDQIYIPALKRVLDFIATTRGANYSLYVYDGELMSEPQLREVVKESNISDVETIIILHHQELAALIDSNFTALPT
ncbi:MAG: hypothetical protein V7609_1827 [Verrucomicrobiota bacterium]